MTRDALIALLTRRDPLEAARLVDREPAGEVTYSRLPAPEGWLVDDGVEGAVEEHRAAHAAGRPSEAVVLYGAGVAEERVADRLRELARLSAETGLLKAVTLVPSEGSASRPGSWGVEDLVVVAAARAVLPDVPWIRPSWRHVGPGAAQVAVGFGATDWQIPAEDDTDVDHLAAAIGCRAVPR